MTFEMNDGLYQLGGPILNVPWIAGRHLQVVSPVEMKLNLGPLFNLEEPLMR